VARFRHSATDIEMTMAALLARSHGCGVWHDQPAQEKSIRRWAKEHRHRLVRVVRDEGVSGRVRLDSFPGTRRAGEWAWGGREAGSEGYDRREPAGRGGLKGVQLDQKSMNLAKPGFVR